MDMLVTNILLGVLIGLGFAIRDWLRLIHGELKTIRLRQR